MCLAHCFFQNPGTISVCSDLQGEVIQQFCETFSLLSVEPISKAWQDRLSSVFLSQDGFLNLSVFEESSKLGRSGALLYSYDYEISTTRARKRIITAVTIFNSKLFIVTGTCKCPKAACGVEEEGVVASLKECVDSFDPLTL